MGLGKILVVGALAAVGYEAYKRYKLSNAKGFVATPGHSYVLTFTAKFPSTYLAQQADAQAALNASAPGLFDVLSMTLNGAGGFTVQAVYTGTTAQSLSASHFTSGWNPSEMTNVMLTAYQDMGAAPAPVAAAAASTAMGAPPPPATAQFNPTQPPVAAGMMQPGVIVAH